MQDYYALLGVSPSASEEEIKRAYRRIAVELHPDRNPSAEERFKAITAAYQVLSTPRTRRAYDDERADSIRPWRGPPRRTAGADLRYRLEVAFEDAVRGITATLEVRRRRTCAGCAGSGARGASSLMKAPRCRDCRGKGRLTDARGRARACARCHGRGIEPIERCPVCDGAGRVEAIESLDVEIPAGIGDGKRLRLRGFGDDGAGGAPAGDLFVVVSVPEHPFFVRHGADVHLEMPVALVQVLLEEEILVPTPDGDAPVKLPRTARTGTKLTLEGKGVRDEEGGRGDLVVTLTVVPPDRLSPREREALLAFRESRPPEGEPAIAAFLTAKARAKRSR